MPHFNLGDTIVILPRFAHLYPINTGVIIDFREDQFRREFDEYTVQFPNGSTANLFEFELVEVGS